MSTDEAEEELIVVAVLLHGAWTWFRSFREYWVLDYIKWEEMFAKAGHPSAQEGYSDRFGIPVVDTETAALFLKHMEPCQKSQEELGHEFWKSEAGAQTWFDVSECMPVLLVDFDARELHSVYSETMRFERFVPDDWIGRFGEFYDRIPEVQRYWSKNGVDGVARFRGVV